MMDLIACPDCKPFVNRKGLRLGPWLDMIESNYSGTDVDFMG